MTEGHAPESAELLPQRGHVIAPPQPPLSRQEAGAKVESLFKLLSVFYVAARGREGIDVEWL